VLEVTVLFIHCAYRGLPDKIEGSAETTNTWWGAMPHCSLGDTPLFHRTLPHIWLGGG